MNTAYILDIKKMSLEISAYLITYALYPYVVFSEPDKFKFNEKIELLVLDLLRLLIDSNTSEKVPRGSRYESEFKAWKSFCSQYPYEGITPRVLRSTIKGCLSFRYIQDIIEEALIPNTTDIWAITYINGTYVLEYLGDYREYELKNERWKKDILENYTLDQGGENYALEDIENVNRVNSNGTCGTTIHF